MIRLLNSDVTTVMLNVMGILVIMVMIVTSTVVLVIKMTVTTKQRQELHKN